LVSDELLVFSTGFQANQAVFSSIPSDTVVIYDEFIHASIRTSLRLRDGKNFPFRHNDLNHLESRLKKFPGAFVAVESLYSMDGDFADLSMMAKLCEKYQAFLVVDEAHSFGVYGENGKGWSF